MARFISPLPYPGGKAKQWKLIHSYFPEKTAKLAYYEPFFGGGSVGFRALENNLFYDYHFSDVDCTIMDMFYDMAHENMHPLTPKSVWEIRKELFHPNLKFEDVERKAFSDLPFWLAALCMYNTNYGSLFYGRPTKARLEQNWNQAKCERIQNLQSLLKKNLDRVNFETKDYKDIKLDDLGRAALFYLDPPYYGVNNLYKHGNDFDWERFFFFLSELDVYGIRFVLSINDHPYIRERLEYAFNIFEHEWFYSSSNSKRKDCKVGKELIITNFIRGRDEYE
jgi:DNA adenine methylase